VNILIEGYLDRNFGDDMMIRIVAHQLSNHHLFIKERKRELLLPFINHSNIYNWYDYPHTKIDLILRIVGSGFMVTDKVGIYYCALNVLNKIKLKRKGLPMAVIGCNVGPFVNGLASWLSRMDMRQYDILTVRDRFSYNFITKYIKNKQVFCYPDILLSIPDEWLPPHTGEDCLGISAYRLQNYSNLDSYKKMAEIADTYIVKNNQKVILFAFDIERENDLAAAFTIRSLCTNRDMVEIVVHDDDGSNIINNMARCSHVISIRLHCCLLAIRMGIPFTPIIYSKKTDYVLDDLGYHHERFYVHNFTVQQVLQSQQNGKVFKVENKVFDDAKKHVETIKDRFLKDR